MKKQYTLLLIQCIFLGIFNSIAAQTPELIHKTDTTFSNVQGIDVTGQFCKIEILKSNDDLIHLQGELSSNKVDPAYKINQSLISGKLVIKIEYPSSGWSSHSGLVKLHIPNGIELSISTTSGRVYVNDAVFSSLNVSTKSGNIQIQNTEGSVKAETVTAKINVSDAKGAIKTKSKTGSHFINRIDGTVSALTSEGAITVADITGTTRTEATTGKTDIDRIKGEIRAKAATGAVNISDSDSNVNVITFSGPIKIFNISGVINLKSTTGNQVGTRIKLTGSSNFTSTEGKIKMELDNPTEELTFVLESKTSYLQAARKSKKKKLKVGKGAIVVTGISTTGAQIYN